MNIVPYIRSTVLFQQTANLCCGLSPQFIKKIHNFLAEVGFKPRSSGPETYALPMSYQTIDEGTTLVEEFKECCEEA